MFTKKFKEWLLKEGAYLEFQEPFKIQGKLVAAIDMRFEDWGIDGGIELSSDSKPPKGNFIARLGNYYIVYSMGKFAKFTKGLNPFEAGFEFVPNGWEKYAEFYGTGSKGNEIVKSAKYDAVKRLSV